jgi:hypothetical protein
LLAADNTLALAAPGPSRCGDDSQRRLCAIGLAFLEIPLLSIEFVTCAKQTIE